MRPFLLSGLLFSACSDGSIQAFSPRLEASAGAPAEPTAGAPATTGDIPLPPSIDDFEDGDTRAREPIGWWYPVNDGTGTQGFGIEPVSSSPGSVYALHSHGSGFEDWGAAVGVNLKGDSPSVTAESYQQLCFLARLEPGNQLEIEVHLLRSPGSIHYRQTVLLTESWARHCLRLTDFLGPNDAALVPAQLTALQFFFKPGAPFGFWLDDIELVP